jgi:transcriptional regulator GlxA family with amidase domain
MKIACVLYEDFTALDLIGPYEVIGQWPDAEMHFLATQTEPVSTDQGLQMIPTDTPATLRDPDIVLMPGSAKPLGPLENEELLQWLRDVAPTAQWMASACTGSGVYAAAGLLEGKRATTHWAFRENLKAMGVDVVPERVVFDGKFITGAGVSAGIDMALSLTAKVHGEEVAKAVQLGIEYDPQPPFDSGSPDKASASTLRLAMRMLIGDKPAELLAIPAHVVRARVARLRGRGAPAGA